MQDLLPRAERLAAILKERRETIVVAESSTGGLISAALLSVPGASAYFLGGAVVYTLRARRALLDIQDAAVAGMRAGERALCVADGAHGSRAILGDLGPCRKRRDRSHRQSLWRRGGSHLPRDCRPDRAGYHPGDRKERSRRQHARLRRRGDGSPVEEPRRRASSGILSDGKAGGLPLSALGGERERFSH